MKYLIKNSKRIGTLGLVALMLFTYACKDLSSFNEDPNEPSDARTTYLLTSAQKSLADNYWGEFELGYFGNLYAQYWSQNQYSDESRYGYRTTVINDIWEDYYLALNTLQQIIRQNRNNPDAAALYGNNKNQIAVAKILKAWTYQNLTDIFGDIPFEEALGGASNPSPAYTPQDSVYTGIINMLTEASDSLVIGETTFTGGDVIYGSDDNADNAAQWKKLANALKMRAAIRIADANPQVAEQAFMEAYNAGAIETNTNNALLTYKTASPNNNPINEAYKTRDDFAISNTLMDFMNSNNDPRRGSYAEPAINTNSNTVQYSGFPYGLAQGQATPYKGSGVWSRPSERVRSATAPAIFMTASEVLFDETEAAQRGWIPADAATKYNMAIKASMGYWDVSSADADSYVTNNSYQAGNWRQNLGRQKWVALYMQGIQGWSVWRRLDFGLLSAPVSGKLGVSFDAPIALRYPYPTDENNLNGDHVDAAVSNQGFSEDDQGQKIWWDKASESAN